MKSPQSSELVSPGASLEGIKLENERIQLRVAPDRGLHWTQLQVAAKGSWLDLILPVTEVGDCLQGSFDTSGCFLMAPWPNRVGGASFEFGGCRYRLRPNFPDGTAIHGDVRTRPWKTVQVAPDRVSGSLDTREVEGFNYPFHLEMSQALELLPDGIRATVAIQNSGDADAPVGFGFHPFLKRQLTPKDRDVILVLPAERVYPSRECLPTAPAVPVSESEDLRDLRPLGARGLDHCYTGLTDGFVRLFYPGSGVQVRFRLDPVFTHAVVYAPNDEKGAPRDFVCVEPITQANDGLNGLSLGWPGVGVRTLRPGESLEGSWELSVGDI